MCAQLASVEAGSAYKSLAGQLEGRAVETTRPLTIQSPPRRDGLTIEGPPLRAQLLASMPQTVARPMATPSLAVPYWPQHLSQSAVDYHFDAAYQTSFPAANNLLPEAPSNSFQSTTFSGAPWSEAQDFQYLGCPKEDLDFSLTAPSSFEVPTHNWSNPASFSLPPVADAPVRPHDQLHLTSSPHQIEHLFEKRSLPSPQLPSTNVSTLFTWAQGPYNVSDRTSYGQLARPGAPPPGPRKRRVTPSHVGSSTSLSCPGCGKTFASKSEKE